MYFTFYSERWKSSGHDFKNSLVNSPNFLAFRVFSSYLVKRDLYLAFISILDTRIAKSW